MRLNTAFATPARLILARCSAAAGAALLLCASLIGALGHTAASAHELQPGYLSLSATAPYNWQVTFKQPQVAGRFLNLGFVSHCDADEPVRNRSENYLIEHFNLNCQGAALEQISISGLEGTLIDVLVSIQPLEGESTHHLLSPRAPSLSLIGAAPPATPVYFRLGITHLLTGLDHVLFVLILPFLISSLTRLFWVITSFTLAHSITLSLATLTPVNLPSAPTEALIAFSIALVAREALIGQSLIRRYPWLAGFLFGLLHGFGFASALTRTGLPQEDALPALFLFNIGIEVGQLTLLLPCLILIAGSRRLGLRLEPLRPYPLYAIGGLSMMWFIQRILW